MYQCLKKNNISAVPDTLVQHHTLSYTCTEERSLYILNWVVSGSQGSRASLSSLISCSKSDISSELEAAAPRSVSYQFLDHADCSDTEIASPTTGRLFQS